MQSFCSPNGQVVVEFKDGLIELYYKGKTFEIHQGSTDLTFKERKASAEDFKEPPYANSWDYRTYVKSEDCDG